MNTYINIYIVLLILFVHFAQLLITYQLLTDGTF